MVSSHTNKVPEEPSKNMVEELHLSREGLDRLAVLTDAQKKLYDLQREVEAMQP